MRKEDAEDQRAGGGDVNLDFRIFPSNSVCVSGRFDVHNKAHTLPYPLKVVRGKLEGRKSMHLDPKGGRGEDHFFPGQLWAPCFKYEVATPMDEGLRLNAKHEKLFFKPLNF